MTERKRLEQRTRSFARATEAISGMVRHIRLQEAKLKRAVIFPQLRPRHAVFLAVVLGSLVLTLAQQPFGQDPAYHQFADRRALFGIQNAFDVLSNGLFLLVGVAGIIFCVRKPEQSLRPAWTLFFLGVASVSLGSAYYHVAPNDRTLVWDRLPMTVGFMALFAALVGEYLGERIGRLLLLPLILIGLGSVLYWQLADDLRFYLWIQVVPLISIPVLVLLFPPGYSHQGLLAVALGWYVLSKIAEFSDGAIFSLTNEMVSGHTLKHVLAALACFTVLVMLARRESICGRKPEGAA